MKNLKIFNLLVIVALLVSSCTKKDAKTSEMGANPNAENSASIPCIQGSLSRNVIAFYPFSNGSLSDESGRGNHLTNFTNAKPTFDRNGNLNCSYEFNNFPSSEEFLTTQNTDFLNKLEQYSVSLWYMPKEPYAVPSLTEYESLIGRGDLGLSCPDKMGEWSIGMYDCRRAVFGRENSVWEKFDPLSTTCESEIKSKTNKWKHVVATFNSKGNVIAIYINGELHETKNGLAVCSQGTPSAKDIGDLFVGKDYTGVIDDIIIFNKTLSDTEVKEVYKMTPCCIASPAK